MTEDLLNVKNAKKEAFVFVNASLDILIKLFIAK